MHSSFAVEACLIARECAWCKKTEVGWRCIAKNTYGATASPKFSILDLQFAVLILQNPVGALIIINLNKFVPNVTFCGGGWFLCGVQS